MKTQPTTSLNFFTMLCWILSFPLAVLHYLAVYLVGLDIPQQIGEAPGGLFRNLRKIWFARLLKKQVSLWVRTPFRKGAFRLVHFDFDIPVGQGLIFVTCHTPWKRLLVNWFFENHYALIIDTGRSIKRQARLKNQRTGYNELRHVIRHLQFGGRIIIAADTFDKLNDHPAELLGKPGNLSQLPARLSRIAGVPMMAAVPRLRNRKINIYSGPLYKPPVLESDVRQTMQKILGFFENEIRKDPSIWSYFVNEPLSQYHKKRIV